MSRIYNFSAGPSMLPEEVLQKAADQMTDYQGEGLSVMEMSHRSKAFIEIIEKAEQTLRDLMNIPSNYKVLFLQGGAHLQFSMVPLNLMPHKKADYIITGNWANKAYLEALKVGDVRIAASSKDLNYSYIPKTKFSDFREDADYVHICVNNTIYGTRFKPDNLPDTGNINLIGDISSGILSEEYDVQKFALLYAGAQKNMGPAGVTVVILREDLLDLLPSSEKDKLPVYLNYQIHADAQSLYNTPPCYAIYMCGLVFEWLKNLGGVKAIEKINYQKANLLYDFLDNSDFYQGTVEKEDRSIMNVPFICKKRDLEAVFIKEAAANGLINLKGHRSVGGMRASIYNAMPLAGVQALITFMQEFESKHRK